MAPNKRLPFDLSGFEIDEVRQQESGIEIVAHSIREDAICPAYQQRSQCVHSYYQRSPADLPITDRSLHLLLTVRRFRCQNAKCPKSTFVERWPQFIPLNAQRTARLSWVLGMVAHALGGQGGSRLATCLNMSTSGDTLLRILRGTPEQGAVEPEIIGIDDWAKRRGRIYGTVVVDLVRRCVIELLPDRTAETLAKWLTAHPRIKIVARDRSGEYARGIVLGAPQAQQVADRWHLLVNLQDAFARMLDRVRPELMSVPTPNRTENSGKILFLQPRRYSPGEEILRDHRRARRLELHEKVHRLRRAALRSKPSRAT